MSESSNVTQGEQTSIEWEVANGLSRLLSALIDQRVEAALKRRDDDRHAALEELKKSIGLTMGDAE